MCANVNLFQFNCSFHSIKGWNRVGIGWVCGPDTLLENYSHRKFRCEILILSGDKIICMIICLFRFFLINRHRSKTYMVFRMLLQKSKKCVHVRGVVGRHRMKPNLSTISNSIKTFINAFARFAPVCRPSKTTK